MKRLIVYAMGAMLLLSSCQKSITGEGAQVAETRTTADFDAVQLEGSGEVSVKFGNTQSVTVSGYANLVPIFTTSVRNRTLILKFEDEYRVRRNNIRTEIVVPDIKRLKIQGSGLGLVDGFANATSIQLDINGSGEIIVTNSVFGTLTTTINGSGEVDARSCPIPNVEATVNGSGDIKVNCTSDLKATVNGSGTIRYLGNPYVYATINGSGSIKRI